MATVDVIVVEDSPEIRDLVRFSLSLDPSFAIVGEAGDPIEALPLVAELEPDVVLLDLAMPRMGGLEAIDHVRRASPASAIVIYSSLLERHQGARARELGADSYLEKGASIDIMRETLRAAATMRTAEHRVSTDAQQRPQTEQALEISERRFRELTESAPVGILALDQDNRLTFANSELERITGYDAEQMAGFGWRDVIDPDDRDRISTEAPSREDGDVSVEFRIRRADGVTRTVAVRSRPSRDPEGQISGRLASVVDVTGERDAAAELVRSRVLIERQNAELERSNAELQEFAYVASHDLQEPLRVIGGFVDLLRQRYEGQLDEDADRFIGATVSGVERMSQLIDDLLVYSRVGRDQIVREEVDSAAVVRGVLDRLDGPIAESGVEVRLGALPVVSGEPVLLGQIFQNLLSNAVKFSTGEDPMVEISGVEENGGWRFVVADNGEGIDEEHRDQIFEMFKRLHGRSVPGTGIGLAICKRIVERHGGRIWVEPRAGGGSAFTFTLHR